MPRRRAPGAAVTAAVTMRCKALMLLRLRLPEVRGKNSGIYPDDASAQHHTRVVDERRPRETSLI
jgi:hypothetical protein